VGSFHKTGVQLLLLLLILSLAAGFSAEYTVKQGGNSWNITGYTDAIPAADWYQTFPFLGEKRFIVTMYRDTSSGTDSLVFFSDAQANSEAKINISSASHAEIDSITLSDDAGSDGYQGHSEFDLGYNPEGDWKWFTGIGGVLNVQGTSGFRKGSRSHTEPDSTGDLKMGVENRSSDSLIGYWRLDETSGDALDHSGNGYDGVPKNGVTQGVDGVLNSTSYSFDGSDDLVEIQGDSGMDPGHNLTLEAWFKPSTISPADTMRIFNRDNSATYGFYVSTGGNLIFPVDTGDSGGSWQGVGYGLPSADQWYHAVGTYNGTHMALYVNGDLKDVDKQTGRVDTAGVDEAMIGAWPSSPPGDFFSGEIDQVRIYDTALPRNDVLDNVNPSPAPYTSHFSDAGSIKDWKALSWRETLEPGTDIRARLHAADSVSRTDSTSDWNSGTAHGTNVTSERYNLQLEGRTGSYLSSWTSGPADWVNWEARDWNAEPSTTGAVTPIHRWKMDEGVGGTTQDNAGSSDGTLNGDATWITECKQGACLDMDGGSDGSSDHVEIPNDASLNPREEVTISLWVNVYGNTGDFQAFFDKGYGQQWYIGTANGDSEFRWHNRLRSASDFPYTDQYTFSYGQWYHLAMTYNNDTKNWSRYVNGELIGSDIASCSGNDCLMGEATNNDLCLGDSICSVSTNHNNLSGKVDDVRMYDTALDPVHIESLYRDGAIHPIENQISVRASEYDPSDTDLVGSWSFEGTEQQVADSSGNGNHGYLGSGIGSNFRDPLRIKGYSGRGLDFDGHDNQVEIPSSPSTAVGADATFSFWLKRDGSGKYGNADSIFAIHRNFWIWVDRSTQEIVFESAGSNGNWGPDAHSTGTVPNDRWTHVTVVRENVNNVTFYIDGQKAGEDTTYDSELDVNPLRMGAWSPSRHTMDGRLDEVRIYDRDLSGSEVKKLYNLSDFTSGLARQEGREFTIDTVNPDGQRFSPEHLQYRVDVSSRSDRTPRLDHVTLADTTGWTDWMDRPNQSVPIRIDGFEDGDLDEYDGAGPFTATNTVSRNGSYSLQYYGGTGASFSVSSQSGWNRGVFRETSADREDNSGTLGMGYRNGTAGDSKVGYWRLDQTSGSVTDYSGEGNDGANNGATRGTQGVFGTNAFGLDSSNDEYVTISNDASLQPSETTYAVWFRTESCCSTGTGDELFYAKETAGPWNKIGLFSDGRVRYTADTGSAVDVDSQNTYDDGRWHLAVGTYNGSTARLYVDGVTVDSASLSGSLDYSSADARIGKGDGDDTSDRTYDGELDEVMVFDRALSAAEIRDMFMSGPPTNSLAGYWRLDGTSGTVRDSSGNRTHGEIKGTIERGTDGVFNSQSFNFSGSDNYVDLQNKSLHGEEATISAWYNIRKCCSDESRIISKGTSPANQDHWYMVSMDDTDALRFRLKTGGTTDLLKIQNVVTRDTWHHVVARYNGTHMALFQDGTEIGTKAKTGTIDPGTDVRTFIGNSPNAARQFTGRIDEVQLYESSLSDGAIQDLYRNGPGIYSGEYHGEVIDTSSTQSWDRLLVDSQTLSDTRSNAVFQTVEKGQYEVGTEASVNGWTTVDLEGQFNNPVVIVTGQDGADTSEDVETSRPSIRNIQSDSFEVIVSNDQGDTVTEDVGYLVMEEGHHIIDGLEVEAGTYTLNSFNSPQTVSYQDAFPGSTAVADTMQEWCGTVLESRVTKTSLSSGSYEIYWDEFNSTSPTCSSPTAGYVAVERGKSNSLFESGIVKQCAADADGGGWCSVSFSNSYSSAPQVFLNPMGNDGGNPTVAGRQAISTSGFDSRAVESRDIADGPHTDLDIPWIAWKTSTGYRATDSQVINLSDGLNEYTLSVSDSEDARVIFNGTSTDPTQTWEVNNYGVCYSGTCKGDIVSHRRLNSYPEEGHEWTYWFRPTDGSIGNYTLLFAKQEDGTDQNSYRMEHRPDTNDIRFVRDQGGSRTVLASDSVNWQGGQWHRVRINWQEPGDFTIEVQDNNGTVLAQLTASDSTYTEGGIGWTGSTDQDAYFDHAVVDAPQGRYGQAQFRLSTTDPENTPVLENVGVASDTHDGGVAELISTWNPITFTPESIGPSFYLYGMNSTISLNTGDPVTILFGDEIRITSYSPTNTSLVEDSSTFLNITADTPSAAPLNYSFYDHQTDSLIGKDTRVSSGNQASTQWSGLAEGNSYRWYVNITDGNGTKRSPVLMFDVAIPPSITCSDCHTPDVTEEGENITFNPSVTDSSSYTVDICREKSCGNSVIMCSYSSGAGSCNATAEPDWDFRQDYWIRATDSHGASTTSYGGRFLTSKDALGVDTSSFDLTVGRSVSRQIYITNTGNRNQQFALSATPTSSDGGNLYLNFLGQDEMRDGDAIVNLEEGESRTVLLSVRAAKCFETCNENITLELQKQGTGETYTRTLDVTLRMRGAGFTGPGIHSLQIVVLFLVALILTFVRDR
jgi:hypothetical protein